MKLQKTSVKSLVILPALFFALFINGCGGEEEKAKSMDQIQQEEGIPVQVEAVQYKPFEKYMNYFAKLAGVKEATKGAPFGGKIEKINFRVGDYVEEDQVVVEFPYNDPGSVYEQAAATYENSKKTYERSKVLLDAGEISQSNFDNVEAQYLVHKRNYELARKLIFIQAPFSGTLVDLKVNEGDNVKSEAPLFTIAQLHKMRAKIWVTEKEIGMIKKGMEAEMEFGGKIYKGRIVEVSMAIDPYKQAIFAEVEFDNLNRELKSGVTVEIKVLIYKNPKAITIPRNLVMSDENGQYVYVEKDGKAEKRYISNGQETGIYFEISKGLEAGDRLITHGASQLTDGAKVKVIQ
jgi:RND family efflux transporter MFP subunit